MKTESLTTPPLLTLLAVIAALLMTSSVGAAPALYVEFQEGSSSLALGVTSRVATSGPVIGPLAMIGVPGGMAILDTVNTRVVGLDPAGKILGSVGIPSGFYKDLAVMPNGRLWTIDEENRAAIRLSGGTVDKPFSIATGSGFPEQFDSLAIDGEALVIGDFATRALYWFAADGTLVRTASWPTSLGIVATSTPSRVAFLALGEDDRYDTLVQIDRNGRASAVKVDGEALDGARLIGFLPDGRPAGLGILSREPLVRQVFAIDATGLAIPLATIPLKEPLLLSLRPAVLVGWSCWINLSSIFSKKVVVGRFDLPHCGEGRQ